MDFWDLTKLMFRRWYVSGPMLLVTFAVAGWTGTSVEPDYVATAHVQLIPPAVTVPATGTTGPTAAPRNPWLDLGLGALSAAGAVTVQDQKVVEDLEAAHLSTNYTVQMVNQVPLVTFEVVGDSSEQSIATAAFVTKRFSDSVAALQNAYGAPAAERISTRRLDLGNNVTESSSKVKRALVAVIAAGLLLTVGVTILVDFLLRRRANRDWPGVRAAQNPPPVGPGPTTGMASRQPGASVTQVIHPPYVGSGTSRPSPPTNGAADGSTSDAHESASPPAARNRPTAADDTIVLPNFFGGSKVRSRGDGEDQ